MQELGALIIDRMTVISVSFLLQVSSVLQNVDKMIYMNASKLELASRNPLIAIIVNQEVGTEFHNKNEGYFIKM